MSEPRLLWRRNKPSIRNYTVAVLSTAAALGIARWPEVHLESAPVSLFLCAVMLSAWLGGVGPGLLATVLSAAAFAYHFVSPIHSLAVDSEQMPRFVTRASGSISRDRARAKKTVTESERVDMNEAIREVLALAQAEARRNKAAIRTELAGDLPPVRGDRVQLQQVVLNLVINGIEAMSTVQDRPRELVIRTQTGEAHQGRVTVQDSGIGLDRQTLERIFDAFYTTKPEGLGMGLSISRSIVENHAGRLSVVAHDGPGTT